MISEIMTPNPSTMDWQENVNTVLNARFPAYVVEKNGMYYGIVAKRDLNDFHADHSDTIENYIMKTALTTEADIDVETLRTMIRRAERSQPGLRLRFIPVLDNGKVIGVITTNDMDSRYSEKDNICEECGKESEDLAQIDSGAYVCPDCRRIHGNVDEFILG